MREKKLLLAKVLCRTGSLRALRALARPCLVVLNYHRISRDDVRGETQFEEGVFGPSARQFERQMRWISTHTEVLTEADVIERLVAGRDFGTPSTLVTFDDGYIDNYDTAFPILHKLAIPAIFFIPTGLISSRQLGWWDIAAYLVKRSTKDSIRVGSDVIPLDDRSKATRRLISKLKHGGGAVPHSVESLAEACDVALPSTELQGRELMSWEQIREVSRNGIAIGSHTHNHLILSNLDREAQREELRTSKHILESELGKPVRSVAYPFGGSLHFGADSKSLASECGYDIAFTFQGKANTGRHIDRFGIKRFRAPDDLDLMAASILFPAVFQ